jgi:diguanylate cyclase (GGDEF)-like protein
MPDPLATARLRAYDLMEAAQAEDHDEVRVELLDLESDALAEGWVEVAHLAATGVVLHDLVHSSDRAAVERGVGDLLARAPGLGNPALLAAALALRAICAGAARDSAGVLADAGRAVALVERDGLVPEDRCFVWVLCAGAYNTLNLWELADELYDRAIDLEPACERPTQHAAVVVDRILIRLDWAASLFEHGSQREALEQIDRAARAVGPAMATPRLPNLWLLDVLACRELLGLVQRSFGETAPDPDQVVDDLAMLDVHRTALEAAGDIEVLPFLESFAALALLRLGHREAARARLESTTPWSASSGSHAFRAWVLAEVLAPEHPDTAYAASRAYGTTVCDLRWSARLGVLAAARSAITDERVTAEHALLSRDVLLDPLTGLLNRRSFDRWLLESSGPDRHTALLLIDIDRFKRVNDVHGHHVGDEALRAVAREVGEHVRTGDTAVRLGGDEFAVIITAPESFGDEAGLLRVAAERAEAIRSAVAGLDWAALSPGLDLSVSIGLATARLGGHHPDAAVTLYERADADLYEAKARGADARST